MRLRIWAPPTLAPPVLAPRCSKGRLCMARCSGPKQPPPRPVLSDPGGAALSKGALAEAIAKARQVSQVEWARLAPERGAAERILPAPRRHLWLQTLPRVAGRTAKSDDMRHAPDARNLQRPVACAGQTLLRLPPGMPRRPADAHRHRPPAPPVRTDRPPADP